MLLLLSIRNVRRSFGRMSDSLHWMSWFIAKPAITPDQNQEYTLIAKISITLFSFLNVIIVKTGLSWCHRTTNLRVRTISYLYFSFRISCYSDKQSRCLRDLSWIKLSAEIVFTFRMYLKKMCNETDFCLKCR